MSLDSIPAEFIFTMTVRTGDRPPAVIPGGPFGTRIVITAMAGTFEGPRMKGEVADVAGGDWVVVRPNGVMKLDVRLVLRTHDGADILMTYTGLGRRDADGSTVVRTAPQFETGDERYCWLNDVQAVGRGTVGEGTVTYDVYALT